MLTVSLNLGRLEGRTCSMHKGYETSKKIPVEKYEGNRSRGTFMYK